MSTSPNYSTTMSFHPYNERLSNYRGRALKLKNKVQALRLCCELENFEKISAQAQKAARELFPIRDDADAADWFKAAIKRLSSISPQLQASALTLGESCKKIDAILEHIKQLLQSGNINPAVQRLLEVESKLLQPSEQVTESLLRIVTERLSERAFPELVVLDFILREVFGQALERQLSSQDPHCLPPVFFSNPDLIASSQWIDSQKRLSGENLSIPFGLATVVPSVFEQPHNLIRAYAAIARRLYDELLIDSEIKQLIATLAIQSQASQNEQVLLQSWAKDICSEAIACAMAGPNYLGANIEQFAADAHQIATASATDRGCSAYLRWFLLASVLRSTGFQLEADAYLNSIVGLYGPPEFALQFGNHKIEQRALIERLPVIVRIVLETPLQNLQNASLQEHFLPFDTQAQAETSLIAEQILETANKLTSTEPSKNGKASKEDFSLTQSTPLASITAAPRSAFEQACMRGEAPLGFAEATRIYLLEALSKRLLPKTVQKAPITMEQAQRLSRRSQKLSRMTLGSSSSL